MKYDFNSDAFVRFIVDQVYRQDDAITRKQLCFLLTRYGTVEDYRGRLREKFEKEQKEFFAKNKSS